MKISKKLKVVFKRLIPIYQKAILECPKKDWFDYLKHQHLEFGVCLASMELLDIQIYDEMKVLKLNTYYGYWFKRPYDYTSRKYALKSLQLRLDMMQKLIQS